jgi:hypothetical protein
MDMQSAQGLLNQGIPWSPKAWSKPYPQRLYVVHQGSVYRATPTNPGTSYHGFPEMLERLPPGRKLREQILERARALGCEAEVNKWMKG